MGPEEKLGDRDLLQHVPVLVVQVGPELASVPEPDRQPGNEMVSVLVRLGHFRSYEGCYVVMLYRIFLCFVYRIMKVKL